MGATSLLKVGAVPSPAEATASKPSATSATIPIHTTTCLICVDIINTRTRPPSEGRCNIEFIRKARLELGLSSAVSMHSREHGARQEHGLTEPSDRARFYKVKEMDP